jgi:predicted RNA-binding protein YlqC (UPF0109 family)
MKAFLENIVKNIVENPEAVVVVQEEIEDRTNFTISVADEDMGRVIGKDGKVINAIRLIMRVLAIRQNARVRVDIQDKPKTEASSDTQTQEVTTEPEAQLDLEPTVEDLVGDQSGTTTVLDNSDKSDTK